jgi:hypothetical protein
VLVEKPCRLIAVVNSHTESLPQPIMTCCASGYGPKGRYALVTGQLNDLEEGSIGMGRAQKFVISTDFINGRLRECHPTIASPTEKSLMQATIMEGHRTYLSLFLWVHIYCSLNN